MHTPNQATPLTLHHRISGVTAVFSRIDPLNLGVANLTIRLTDLLVRRIKTVLPVMKFEVQEMQAEKAAARQQQLTRRRPFSCRHFVTRASSQESSLQTR